MALADIRDVPTSAENANSLAIYDLALDEALALRGDPVATIDTALDADPGFAMGHCFRAQMHLLSMERPLLGDAARDIELAQALSGRANTRERGHIAAARAWLVGKKLKLYEPTLARKILESQSGLDGMIKALEKVGAL